MQNSGLLFVTASADPVTVIVCEASRNNAPPVAPTNNGGAASAANAIINDGNNACKRNGAARVKKWRVAEFGHYSAQNYQNMKKGTSLTPA